MRIVLAVLAAPALLLAGVGCASSSTPPPTTAAATTAGPATAAPPPATTAPGPATTAPEPPATTPAGPLSLTLFGDSIAVLVTPALGQALPGWTVSVDGLGGRTLAEGMERWRERRGRFSTVLAFSLFTNTDHPDDVAPLRAAVREVLAGANSDCVVWGDVARPPLPGGGWQRANALLERLAADSGGRLVIVRWAETVAARPGLIGPDRIHPTPAGVAVLAGLYADAAKRCAARS